MTIISSAEIADLMLRNKRFLTITEVTKIAQESYPDMVVTREKITNIIRHFVRSAHACCEQQFGIYPHKYLLHCLVGYQFKVRGRSPDFSALKVSNTSKSIRANADDRRREMLTLANKIFARLERERRESIQCQK